MRRRAGGVLLLLGDVRPGARPPRGPPRDGAGSVPLVGVGGILSGADAVAKMSAGASLVQFYTGMIYRGPELVRECVEAIRRRREHPSGGPVGPA